MNCVAQVYFLVLVSLNLLSGYEMLPGGATEKKSLSEDSLGFVSVDGAQLHYHIEGRGIPCIFIGHAESSRILLSRELRDHFKFIFIDLRHDVRSKSSLKVSEITLNTYIEDIDAVSTALGLGPCSIWGHSHYAYLALKYAQKYPGKVSRIITTACPPRQLSLKEQDEFWESDASKERKALFKQQWDAFLLQQPEMTAEQRRIASFMAMAPKMIYEFKVNPAFTKVAWAMDNDREVYLHFMLNILKDYDLGEALRHVAVPVFLAVGRYDYLAPYILWDEIKKESTNLEYHLFQISGHFPMIEEQALFDQSLIEWSRR